MQEDLLMNQLSSLKERFERLEMRLSDPAVWQDRSLFQKLTLEHAELKEIVNQYKEYKTIQESISENSEALQNESDEGMRALYKDELSKMRAQEPILRQKLQISLLPKDPNDERNVILEIRAGTGGKEAALFAAELFRMYQRYSEKVGWKVEILSTSHMDGGGFKDISAQISGDKVFSKLKYESGVHRVQRVPETESQGRVHTSAVTVAVLPEADEVDVKVEDKDLRIDVFRASGPGGQSVNTTDSAVRITHIPSGMIVICQDEKSQLKNKAKAMTVMLSRLYELELAKQHEEETSMRRAQIGSGDRSEKIRTYNFPQSRVSDHRINLTLYSLDSVIQGNLGEVLEPLLAAMQAALLQEQTH